MRHEEQQILGYRPAHHQRLGPESLGSCDYCGTDVPLTGHLYKQPDRSYACEACDILTNVQDCDQWGGGG